MIYNKFKQKQWGGVAFNFTIDTLKVALMSVAYHPQVDDEFWAGVKVNEIVAGGYPPGGVVLAGKTLIQGADLTFDADDINLNIATGAQIGSLVIYRFVTTDNDSELICVKEYAFPRIVIANTLKIQWADLGILLLR